MTNALTTAMGKSVQATQTMVAAKATKDDIAKMIVDGETKQRSKEQNTTANIIKVNEEAGKTFQF